MGDSRCSDEIFISAEFERLYAELCQLREAREAGYAPDENYFITIADITKRGIEVAARWHLALSRNRFPGVSFGLWWEILKDIASTPPSIPEVVKDILFDSLVSLVPYLCADPGDITARAGGTLRTLVDRFASEERIRRLRQASQAANLTKRTFDYCQEPADEWLRNKYEAAQGNRPGADVLEQIESNISGEAWPAIDNPETFPWHRSGGQVDAYQTNSSQALAIDFFGTLKMAPARDAIISHLARRLGLPDAGPWDIQLEWQDKQNILNEPRPTQVDAIAISDRAVILFECKFWEHAGSCSQPRPLPRTGLPQCTGSYERQPSPDGLSETNCPLTAKGIRYWDYIPIVFDFSREGSYDPCPFKGPWCQIMRNLVLAAALEETSGRKTAVVLAYADIPNAATPEWLRSPDWTRFKGHLLLGGVPFAQWSYQEIIALAREVDPESQSWPRLLEWIKRKFEGPCGE